MAVGDQRALDRDDGIDVELPGGRVEARRCGAEHGFGAHGVEIRPWDKGASGPALRRAARDPTPLPEGEGFEPWRAK